MKSSIKSLFFMLTLVITTSSCVSNYVVSNNSYYKHLKTSELLAHNNNSKGPNVISVTANKLIEGKENISKSEISTIVEMDFATEKAFSKEAFNLIIEAKTYLGTPYRYGGTTRSGIDCSSFVQHVFDASNISLPRTSAMQALEGQYVAKESLKKGDLIFFAHTPRSRVSHVGIVERVSPEGEIFFIHSSSSRGVTVSSLDGNYWKSRYRSGKRILSSNFEENNIIRNKQTENEQIVRYDF